MGDVVPTAVGSRFSSGSRPLRYSSGNSLKSAMYDVWPFFVAILMKSRPPRMATITPIVAVVMPRLAASSQPSPSKAEPMAAAVPWPP